VEQEAARGAGLAREHSEQLAARVGGGCRTSAAANPSGGARAAAGHHNARGGGAGDGAGYRSAGPV
jgi:hypothetical protein